jgi:N-glycosylase/DNA lyase
MPERGLPSGGLDLRRTLDSGQAFRWRWERDGDGSEVAVGIVGRHRVRIRQDAKAIHVLPPASESAREAVVRYLGLGGRRVDARDGAGRATLPEIESALAQDPVLARVLPHTRGTGLLVQDPWEALISFLISQNNNIPKIARSIDRLARLLGEPLGDGVYAFPVPERLAAARPQTLRACHLGYRAPYVREAARRVADGRLDLEALRRLPEGGARDALLALPGIGEKVADCILLFALGHGATFPLDLWIRRAVERLYFGGRRRPVRELRDFARARFGPLAGYAQQHLFAYARVHLKAPRRHHRAAT